jgi:hypothetical protein
MFWFDDVTVRIINDAPVPLIISRNSTHPTPTTMLLPITIRSYWQIPFASSTSLNPLSSKQKQKKARNVAKSWGYSSTEALQAVAVAVWLWLVSFAHAFMHVEHATK